MTPEQQMQENARLQIEARNSSYKQKCREIALSNVPRHKKILSDSDPTKYDFIPLNTQDVIDESEKIYQWLIKELDKKPEQCDIKKRYEETGDLMIK